jgi:hypothetical protein
VRIFVGCCANLSSRSATGAFIYCYAYFFFTERSEMSGFLQGSFFFGYMALVRGRFHSRTCDDLAF